MTSERKIKGGVYVVIDPVLGIDYILPAIEQAIEGGADVLQLWNNWKSDQNKHEFIEAVCRVAHAANIPVLINEEWQLLRTTELDGVHFDTIPANFDAIRQNIERPFICGITCGNNLTVIKWATDNNLDYISFCSMFPSPSAGVCEIVMKETVMQARQLTSLPIFLSGGITLNNIDELTNTGMNGIAVISAIIKAENPQTATKAFKEKLATFK